MRNSALKCMRSPTSAYHLTARSDDSVEKIRSNNALGQLFGMERLLYSQQAVPPAFIAKQILERNGCARKNRGNIVAERDIEILE